MEDVSLIMTKYKFKTTKRKSYEMSRVHSIGGQDELILRKLLWHKGVRYRVNVKGLPGKPDIVISKYKIIVMIDGEFWHGYDWPKHRPKRNTDYWTHKIEYNMAHDRKVNAELEAQGWTVLRFWSKQVLKNPEYYAEIVMWYIRGKKEES